MSNWDALSEEEKKDLSSMNHLFCNLHAVIGFADYSDSALKSLEGQWRRDSGQLGTETLRVFQNKNGEYSWSHSDSAVQRLIRTACDALSPGGDPRKEDVPRSFAPTTILSVRLASI